MINSWNEWDPLESVLVGTALGARVPQVDTSLKAIAYAQLEDARFIPSGAYPQQVIEEAEEDLTELCQVFEKLGIQVHRPQVFDSSSQHGNPFWKSDSQYFFCPRDSALVIGDMIIETPMPIRARYSETLAYRALFAQAFEAGAKWLSAPRPLLSDNNYLDKAEPKIPTLTNEEICFDAANVLRCGRDLFYLVSNSGNLKGARWLQSILGQEFKVHTLEGLYSYMHIDSTISLLRPGLALLNPARIQKDSIPAPLDKWDVLWCPEPIDIGFQAPYENASTWIGMNLFMVRPDLAIVEATQVPLINLLEKNQINVIPVKMRHQRTLGGGAHCVTLDLKRTGKLESYF